MHKALALNANRVYQLLYSSTPVEGGFFSPAAAVVEGRQPGRPAHVEIKNDDLTAWEEWALGYADRIDPVLSGQIFSHISKPELD